MNTAQFENIINGYIVNSNNENEFKINGVKLSSSDMKPIKIKTDNETNSRRKIREISIPKDSPNFLKPFMFDHNRYIKYVDYYPKESMPKYCFANSNIDVVDAPNITLIENGTFMNCKKLSCVYSDNVKIISSKAFDGCSNLFDVRYNPELTQIGDYAFRNSGIISFCIPDSIITIGQGIFEKCSKLKYIYMSKYIYEKYFKNNDEWAHIGLDKSKWHYNINSCSNKNEYEIEFIKN